MGHGTTVNGVYASRIHRCNAQQMVYDAEHCIARCRDELLVMAASTPPDISGDNDFGYDIIRDVSENVELIQEQSVTRFLAQYIIDCPDEVVDDYDAEMFSKTGLNGQETNQQETT